MSSGAERKARTRELRRLGYRGEIAFQIHEDAIDRLVALGALSEGEATDLDCITEAVERLINARGLEQLITGCTQHLPEEDERLPDQSPRPQMARPGPDDILFTY
jgi:hypothetical protein